MQRHTCYCTHVGTTTAAAARTQQTFAEVSQLLRDVVEGTISTVDFGARVRDCASDETWVAALGRALREMGSISEATNRIAYEKQRQIALASAELAIQRQTELSAAKLELSELRSKLSVLEDERGKMAEQLSFLNTFPSSKDALKKRDEAQTGKSKGGSAFLSAMRRAQVERAKAEAAEATRAAAALAEGPDRYESISLRSQHLKGHQKAFEERERLLRESHAAELERIERRITEERRQFTYAHESREELALERRKGEERRLAYSAAESEQCRVREASARAQAAAASEVLQETQGQVHALRAELERAKIDLMQSKEKLLALEAEARRRRRRGRRRRRRERGSRPTPPAPHRR